MEFVLIKVECFLSLRVLYLSGHPAEAQLSDPIIRRMQNDSFFQVEVRDVQRTHEGSCGCVNDFLEPFQFMKDYDFVVSPCDRVEIVVPTYYAFLSNHPIVRIYGGLTGSGTHDDTVRHVLDTLGHIHLVESEEAQQNLIRSGEEPWRIHIVGITHLDDIEPDYSLCPTDPYAVFLMNPVTVSRDQTRDDVQAALLSLSVFLQAYDDAGERAPTVIFLPPNGDLYSDVVTDQIREAAKHLAAVTVCNERIPRPQFLGLLSRCVAFISNSSATVYEAPVLAPKAAIYNPSWRNKERTKPPKLEAGGSDRIIKVLKEFDWKNPDLLRKRFRYGDSF